MNFDYRKILPFVTFKNAFNKHNSKNMFLIPDFKNTVIPKKTLGALDLLQKLSTDRYLTEIELLNNGHLHFGEIIFKEINKF